MPASPSIQQMPEFAATIPSRPFPATAVGIAFVSPFFGGGLAGTAKLRVAQYPPGSGISSKDVYNVAIPSLSRKVGRWQFPNLKSTALWSLGWSQRAASI